VPGLLSCADQCIVSSDAASQAELLRGEVDRFPGEVKAA
jgi:hypothetical protein